MPIYETQTLSYYAKYKIPKFTNLFHEKHNISQFDYHILPKSPKDTVIRSYNSLYSYVSSSLNVIPFSKYIFKRLKIPLSIIFSPYRNLHEGDGRIPIVNPETIAMCTKCYAYINPYVTFIDDNSRYRCNICNQINTLPSFYKWSGKKGMKRPELVNPVVDYIFPEPPENINDSIYLFVVDVSYISIQSGMVYTIANIILNTLDKIPNPNGKACVGFITVDSTVHFFKFYSNTEAPSMIILSDLEEVFLPSPTGLFTYLKDSRKAIEEFLKKLNKIFSFSYVNSNALGSALKAGYEILKNVGGKMIVFQSILPDVGLGALKVKNPEEEKESTLFQPSDKYYPQFAKECNENKICIDLFLFPHQFLDISTLSTLCKNTSGSLYVYENFNSSVKEDENKLVNELTKVLTKSVGYDAVAFFNLSKGLTIQKVHGNISKVSSNKYIIPILNPENSFTLEMDVTDDINDTDVSIQFVLAHFNDKGERKIRIITQSFPTSSNLTAIVENIDICTLSVDNTINYGAEYTSNTIENNCNDLVKTLYNIFLSKDENKLLKVPSTLKLLPLFTLALLNNEAFRKSKSISIDTKSYLLNQIYSKSLNTVMNIVLPRFYSIHSMNSKVGSMIEDIKGSIHFPNAQNLCSDRIEGTGIYLIDNGLELYIWISKNSNSDLLQSLFNKNYDAISSGKMELPQPQDDYSKIIHQLISKIREHHILTHNCYPVLYIIKESSPKLLKRNFFANLIEDRHEYAPSYPQYLNILLKQLKK
ncbi:hypothetical protein BCR32DRAFT_200622 [Anaeromyces robustus]|uniref:Sec24-like protein n=1 Tax=Anaeromyces robustus TaxID=1754192 RepID=A0A1Y1XG69_9FUNG|nr:hypothetical protein BCR32DRAFT_200622 [Anaeromyces robustus]|eukprot:ORX84745.1 hypothetical protein BCR32DRAFT_200622 [Anaeromyces robustus]